MIATKIVHDWSFERDDTNVNAKTVASEANISFDLWSKSYQWAKKNKQISGVKLDGNTTFFIPARDLESIPDSDLKKYKSGKYSTFDQFQKIHFSIWRLESNDQKSWKSSKCNFPMFLKNFICKHVVGMGIRSKKCKPPYEKEKLLGQKMKRGRPTLARRALLVQ
jgi:hypothetical protein